MQHFLILILLLIIIKLSLKFFRRFLIKTANIWRQSLTQNRNYLNSSQAYISYEIRKKTNVHVKHLFAVEFIKNKTIKKYIYCTMKKEI